MAQNGKANSRSYLRDERRAVEDLKALMIDINQCRINIKRLAWQTADRELFSEAEAIKTALVKMKRIYNRYWHDLTIELEED